jgi:hypothetical protein
MGITDWKEIIQQINKNFGSLGIYKVNYIAINHAGNDRIRLKI